jgi:hypothetical protein
VLVPVTMNSQPRAVKATLRLADRCRPCRSWPVREIALSSAAAVSALMYLRRAANSTCVSSSANEPRAMRRCRRSTRSPRWACPSAMLLGTDVAALLFAIQVRTVQRRESCGKVVRRNCQVHCCLPCVKISKESNDRRHIFPLAVSATRWCPQARGFCRHYC